MFKFPWMQKKTDKISREEAQSKIDGVLVAKIQREFREAFRETYGDDFILTNGSMVLAVGPMQTFLGLAIANGHLKLGDNNEQV